MGVQCPIAVEDASPFPIENIPFGIFSTESDPEPRVGTIIGSHVVDVKLLAQRGAFDGNDFPDPSAIQSVLSERTLNGFAAQPRSVRVATRAKIIDLLSDPSSFLFGDEQINRRAFVQVTQATMHLPMQIGAFADFMCSETHHDNGNRVTGNPGIPAFYSFPLMYSGRTTSIVPSGQPIRRPKGMVSLNPPGSKEPPRYDFATSAKFDFEVEMGVFVSNPIPLGQRITADEVDEHVFGLVLLNDWSARDIQFAEMIPMGPSNGKATGTTISPWVIMPEALQEAQSGFTSPKAEADMHTHPAHLQHTRKTANVSWNIELEATVAGQDEAPTTVCRSNLRDSYWTPGQMLAHFASSGCGARTGDLIGTGTASSPGHTDENPTLGCLFELTAGGRKPFKMSSGRELSWLEDGDEVVMTGSFKGKGGRKMGFGEATGRLLPAH